MLQEAMSAPRVAAGAQVKTETREPCEWWRLLGPSPFAQAAFGAVLATLAAPSSGKLVTACVTAAARGAMQGVASAKQGDCDKDGGSAIFDLMEKILVAIADLDGSSSKVGVSRGKAILRDHGRPELASALGRMTKGRNSTAHPDWGLLKEVQALKANGSPAPGYKMLHQQDGAVPSKLHNSDAACTTSSSGLGDAEQFDIASCTDDGCTSSDQGDDAKNQSVEMAGVPSPAAEVDTNMHNEKTAVAARAIGQWADMFSSDSGGSEDLEVQIAPPCNGAKTDWLEETSQRERYEVEKLRTIFGSNATLQQNVDPTFEWLPKPSFDIDVAEQEIVYREIENVIESFLVEWDQLVKGKSDPASREQKSRLIRKTASLTGMSSKEFIACLKQI